MKYFVVFVILLASLFSFIPSVHASYVLPYPSYMPGNKLYRISRFIDASKKWWHWGNIASAKYHLGLADKYLVETKTLFEYKQYLLALDALVRSNEHVGQIPAFIEAAKKEGKDMKAQGQIVVEAMDVHNDVLTKLVREVPAEFFWQPEKSSGSSLKIKELLTKSIDLRQKLRSL